MGCFDESVSINGKRVLALVVSENKNDVGSFSLDECSEEKEDTKHVHRVRGGIRMSCRDFACEFSGSNSVLGR